jgi:hypothetical protein
MPVKTEMIFYGVLAAAATAALVYVAASVASFLGVGLLGLLILFIAYQVDLDKTVTSSVYAMRPPSEGLDHAERAAQRYEVDRLRRPILMSKLIGLGLAVIGFSGLLFG